MPSLWRQSLALLRAPGNELAFAVRSRLRWSRGSLLLPDESKTSLLAAVPEDRRAAAAATVAAIEADHDLAALRQRSTRLVYAENLALLERLTALLADTRLPPAVDGVVRATDIGCGAFAYATGLHRWLRRAAGEGAPRVSLSGVEIDGHGIYRDGHSRADHARAHAALAGGEVAFRVADFLRLELPPQHVVTMLFPFLHAYPLLRWGLPLRHLRPRRLLQRAVQALRQGGLLVVANQTEAEHGRLAALLAGQPVALLRKVSFASDLLPYAERAAGRVGSLWQRQKVLPGDGGAG